MKYGKKLSWSGPKQSKTNKYNYTLFTLKYNKNQLLRIDMRIDNLSFKKQGFVGNVHYHVPPNMEKHYNLFDIPFGKNLPKFPW